MSFFGFVAVLTLSAVTTTRLLVGRVVALLVVSAAATTTFRLITARGLTSFVLLFVVDTIGVGLVFTTFRTGGASTFSGSGTGAEAGAGAGAGAGIGAGVEAGAGGAATGSPLTGFSNLGTVSIGVGAGRGTLTNSLFTRFVVDAKEKNLIRGEPTGDFSNLRRTLFVFRRFTRERA